MPTACRYCGALGACFAGCQCLKCLDPISYHHWVRNMPGDNKSKAIVDREARIRLESNGQQNMNREIWDREKMFLALKDRLVLILERALEKAKEAKNGLSALRLSAPFLREFAGLTGDFVDLTEEIWK